MKPRDAASRSQLASALPQQRRHPLRSPLDLLRRRKKLLAVSVLLTAALALYSGYLHAVWPNCRPASVSRDADSTETQHAPVKGAFVYLVGPDKGEELGQSLGDLFRNVLAEHPRPVILFYGDDVSADELEKTVAALSAPLRKLVEVIVLEDFLQLPEHMRGVHVINEAGKVDRAWIDMYPGYQNMCRWNFMQLVAHPRVQELDYYCRLDTHSFVRSPLGHDVFDFMAARRLVYGFVVAEEEPAHVITGLWDFTEAYLKNASDAAYPPASRALAVKNGVAQRIPPLGQRNDITYPYNNFEVLEVQRFSSPPMRAFNDAVDASHNIYRHRWGDGPLRWIQCLLFLDLAREVHQFTDFEYAHYDDVFNRKIVCRGCPGSRLVG